MINGIIVVCKEAGYTSHDVVAKMRGIFRQKKIGHTGTLDPDAVGVLPVCLGNATKLCDMLTDKSKEYEAVLRLGVVTDTQDMSGTVLKEMPVDVSPEQLREAALSFVGEYDQVPPMYSALKVNGKKLYELARAGKEVERKSRRVCIDSLEVVSVDLSAAVLRVNCSKGTYIRTLCHDIGEKLGCGGAMEALNRTRVGSFGLAEARTLSQLEELVRAGMPQEEYVIPVDSFFAQMPECTVLSDFVKLLQNGNPFLTEHTFLKDAPEDGSCLRVYDEHHIFYGVYRYREAEDRYKPVKMFLN